MVNRGVELERVELERVDEQRVDEQRIYFYETDNWLGIHHFIVIDSWSHLWINDDVLNFEIHFRDKNERWISNMNRFTTQWKGPGADCPTKSAPPFVSSSPAPHLSEEGQPKNAGAQPPRLFLCVRPRRGWGPPRMKWWEVMIYWGNGTAPSSQTLFLVGPHITPCFISLSQSCWLFCSFSSLFFVVMMSCDDGQLVFIIVFCDVW